MSKPHQGSPTVLEGTREPRSVRLEAILGADSAPSAPPALPAAGDPDQTVYVSKYRKYRVQVTAPRSFTDALGRKSEGGQMIVAAFDDGVYRNRERDPKIRALIDTALQSNPYFGKFGGGNNIHFWLASDQKQLMENASIKSAYDTLKSLPPELVQEFVARLEAGTETDHTLPPRE